MVSIRKRSLNPEMSGDGDSGHKKRVDASEETQPIRHGVEENVQVPEEGEENEHSNRVRQRPVACERPISITQLKETRLPDILERRGWLNICKVKVKPAPGIVQEFYANIIVDNEDREGSLHSIVRGKDVQITPAVIARVLDISRNQTSKLTPQENSYIPTLDEVSQELCNDLTAKWDVRTNVLEQASMSADYRLLNMVYNFNIHPRMHSTTLPSDRAQFLFAIGKDHFIDLPLYLFKVIQSAYCSNSKTDILPFGSLITRILRKFGVRAAEGETVGKLMGPINIGTWNKSNAHSKKKGAKTQIPAPGTQPAPTKSAEHPHAVPSTSTTQTNARLDFILAAMKNVGHRMTSLEECVRDEFIELNKHLKLLEDFIGKRKRMKQGVGIYLIRGTK